MPSTATLRPKGGGPALTGRHHSFTLRIDPTWHDTGKSRLSCAERSELLTTAIYLDGSIADPAAERRKLYQLSREPVEVVLGDLTFTGHIISTTWQQFVDDTSRFSGAVIPLIVRGKEAGHGA